MEGEDDAGGPLSLLSFSRAVFPLCTFVLRLPSRPPHLTTTTFSLSLCLHSFPLAHSTLG